ncbi:MAG: CapA family protein [Anaerolineales bacterium]|nr:CapA family protein [Anaerolineales bacterium]
MPLLISPTYILKRFTGRDRLVRLLLIALVFVLVILLAGCGWQAGGNQLGVEIPSATATLNIDMWGVAPLTATASPVPSAVPQQEVVVVEPQAPGPSATATPQVIETPTPSPFPAIDPNVVTSLVFTGSIVPGRCVQAAVDERGNADYLYAEVIDLLTDADLTIGTLNAALSDYPPHTGCIQTFVLVGGSENTDAMAVAGIDLISIATNHIKNCGISNCGDRAFLDTLDNLARVGIQPVGGGLDLAASLQPVVISINDIRFGFISLGQIEAIAFAGPTKAGIAPLNAETLADSLAQVRAQADVVIFLPHWGSDYSFRPNPEQLQYARQAVEQGADLVVGNHSHVIQGMQTIQGVPVFYSLGSFVFDQTWIPEGETEPVLQQGLLLRVTFRGTELQGYELIPVRIADDKSGQVRVAGPDEAADILERFERISAALK